MKNASATKKVVTIDELSRRFRMKPKAVRRVIRNLPVSVRGRHESRTRYAWTPGSAQLKSLTKELGQRKRAA